MTNAAPKPLRDTLDIIRSAIRLSVHEGSDCALPLNVEPCLLDLLSLVAPDEDIFNSAADVLRECESIVAEYDLLASCRVQPERSLENLCGSAMWAVDVLESLLVSAVPSREAFNRCLAWAVWEHSSDSKHERWRLT